MKKYITTLDLKNMNFHFNKSIIFMFKSLGNPDNNKNK